MRARRREENFGLAIAAEEAVAAGSLGLAALFTPEEVANAVRRLSGQRRAIRGVR